jgi:hypothetical protein
MHIVPDISFSPQDVVTDCDAAERYSAECVSYLDMYIVLFCVMCFINVLLPLCVLYFSHLEMLSLDPFWG